MISTNAETTIREGASLGLRLLPGSIVTLQGPLGSGKTTFVKGIAAALGISEDITSPTFTIISEYEGSVPLFHMDLYRISSPDEFEDTGGVELLAKGGVSVIEWPEHALPFLPDDIIRVTFSFTTGGERRIIIEEAVI